ncbi:MAG TPA: RsmE family RNA methyltransferase [Gemmatales bacterium]|nr:RsmE family RNA methyltransferase [Gemmatales bacterium]HMP58944.1 RsmE family RNA methyltransferase [Gemmatales bacterium]
MAERFYVSSPPTPGPYTLTGPEAHHLAVVCRVRPGATVVLFCGDGAEWTAQVSTVGKRQVELHVQEPVFPDREQPQPLIIAAPLPKGDRATFLVEKLTELGVTRFIPLLTARSVVQPGAGKTEKLRRTVIEASKQCGRNKLMQVDEPLSLASLLADPHLPERRLFADPGGVAWGEVVVSGPMVGTVAWVGPEGGLTADEVAEAERRGWQRVRLGPSVLRVETAALALAARVRTEW